MANGISNVDRREKNVLTSSPDSSKSQQSDTSFIDDQNMSETAKKSKAIFANRSIQDFDADVNGFGKVVVGDKLGWSSDFKPEIYKNHPAQEVVRWAYSWTSKKIDGLESSQIAIKWVEAYLQTTAFLKDTETIKQNYKKLESVFDALVQTYKLSAKSNNKTSIIENYKKAAQKITNQISPENEKDLIKFD